MIVHMVSCRVVSTNLEWELLHHTGTQYSAGTNKKAREDIYVKHCNTGSPAGSSKTADECPLSSHIDMEANKFLVYLSVLAS